MKKLLISAFFMLTGAITHQLLSQVTMQPEADHPDLVKVYVKQDPATYQKSNPQNNKIDFAVQVSASSKPIAETKAKEEWDALGHVYVQKENGLYKIRIGPYATQDEAKQTLLKAKSKGTKDAFIVVLQGTENDTPNFSSETDKKTTPQPKEEKKAAVKPETPKTTTTAKSNKVAPTSTVTEVAPASTKNTSTAPTTAPTTTSATIAAPVILPETEYKVRVASYEKPGSFNPNGIEKLGKLESYRKGDVTMMMIGGFKSLPEAQKARDVVISKGFKDASIVIDHDGILEELVGK